MDDHAIESQDTVHFPNCEYALRYAEMGWSVIPISNTTKKPLVSWKEFQARIAEPEEIEKWWTKYPDAAIGVITGEISGIVVVDCDTPEAARKLGEAEIYSTVGANTKRGSHLFFSHPGYRVKNAVGWQGMDNVDVRGDGGYVKVYPSDGYTWHDHVVIEEIKHELPAWTFAEAAAIEELMFDEKEPIPDGAVTGNRNNTMTRIAGQIIQQREDLWGVELLKEVWIKNKEMCVPPLSQHEIKTITQSVMQAHQRNNPDEFDEEGKRKTANLTDRDKELQKRRDIMLESAAIMYSDEPKEREWLVENLIPLGLPGLLASSGGVGKTYMLMDLAAKIALHTHDDPLFLGHPVRKHGRVVMFLYEDDADEINRRMQHIDPHNHRWGLPDNLTLISVPELDDALNFGTKHFDSPKFTNEAGYWQEVLCEMDDLAMVVFDPLQSFFEWRFDEDNVAADRALKWAQGISVKTGATVIFTHHLRKEDMGMAPMTPQMAVSKIRGASNIVNSSRFAIPIWRPNEDTRELVQNQLEFMDASKYGRLHNNSLFMAGLGKENFGGDTSTHWMMRDNDTGILVDITEDVAKIEGSGAVTPKKKTNIAQDIITLLCREAKSYAVDEIVEVTGRRKPTVKAGLKEMVEARRITQSSRGKYIWRGHDTAFDEVMEWVREHTAKWDGDIVPMSHYQTHARRGKKEELWREVLNVIVEAGEAKYVKADVRGTGHLSSSVQWV